MGWNKTKMDAIAEKLSRQYQVPTNRVKNIIGSFTDELILALFKDGSFYIPKLGTLKQTGGHIMFVPTTKLLQHERMKSNDD